MKNGQQRKRILKGVGIAGAVGGGLFLMRKAFASPEIPAPEPPPEGLAHLYGVITSNDGLPLSGVSIVDHSDGMWTTYFTDNEGYYAIPFLQSNSVHKITFEMEGYEVMEVTVTLHEGNNPINVTMIPTAPTDGEGEVQLATLYGEVRDSDTLEPILNVKVTLGSLTAYTDSSGQYIFENVEPGDYLINFEKEGYESWSEG